jgi:hypothetical protein
MRAGEEKKQKNININISDFQISIFSLEKTIKAVEIPSRIEGHFVIKTAILPDANVFAPKTSDATTKNINGNDGMTAAHSDPKSE